MDAFDDVNRGLMQRHKERKEVEWVPYDQRRSESGYEVDWKDTAATFTLQVAGLGSIRIRAELGKNRGWQALSTVTLQAGAAASDRDES